VLPIPWNLSKSNTNSNQDAGGGTVDLIAYRIKAITPHLRIEESGVCTGGKCGGVFVNRVFEAMIDEKLSHTEKPFPDSARCEMRRCFETFVRLKSSETIRQAN
jgi:hypothetical protein